MALESKELREVYTETLVEMAKKDERIVFVDADLMRAYKGFPLRENFPERTVDVGVAEANMIGVAAGLAANGKIPFTHSFTAFATRRCFDQVTISVAYSKLPVKMVGSDPGISAEMNGGTHMSMEDVGLMRALPGMTVFEPVDATQLIQAMPKIVAHEGPVYIRLYRKKAEKIFDETYTFRWGKGDQLKEGTDVTIIATGIMVKEALDASEALQKEGVSARVINIHTVKPIDREIIRQAAEETGAIVTAENHNIFNGLGSAVAEVLVETKPVPMARIGVQDEFGEVGRMPYLKKRFNLEAVDIVAAAKNVIERKRSLTVENGGNI